MKILIIGDIFAKSGRKAVIDNLLLIKQKENIDFVIANAENTTHGRSLNEENYTILKKAGVNIFTMGNHTWDNKDVYPLLKSKNGIVRPYNIEISQPQANIGEGTRVVKCLNKKIRVTNLLSRSCSCPVKASNPFLALDEIIDTNKNTHDIHIIDFHAETTSEKKAILLAFGGQVTAIVGTHTHVQTADEQIYKNTAFITDVGMCGAKESIIGAAPEEIIDLFKEKRKFFKLTPAKGAYQFNSVIIDIDSKTNIPKKITRYVINNN